MSTKLTPAQREALDTIATDVRASGVKGVTLEALERRGMIRSRQRRDVNGYAEEFGRWYLTTKGATEQSRQAEHRMWASVGPRGDVTVVSPSHPGNGTSRHWTRVLSARLYSFTAATMPNGERRYSVSRYDGPKGKSMSAPYWTRIHFIVIPAPVADTEAADSLSTLRADMETAIDTLEREQAKRRASRIAEDNRARRRNGTCPAEVRNSTGTTPCGRALDDDGQCAAARHHVGGEQ